MGKNIEGGSFTRHTTSRRHQDAGDSASEKYPSLTNQGVEKARETARGNLLELIKEAPEGAVLFIGGKSDQDRTGETSEVYGDELKTLGEQENLFVMTKTEIDEIGKEKKGRNATIDEVIEQIKSHPGKVVVDYPLFIKELGYAYKDRWTADGKKTDYFSELVKKYDGSHAEAGHDWIENQGKLVLDGGRELQGPIPEEVAKEYLQGLARLQEFAKKLLPDRTVVVHATGHQWDLDAVVTYLAKGEVTKEGFEEVTGGKIIDGSELVSNITITAEGKTTVNYRGKEFSID